MQKLQGDATQSGGEPEVLRKAAMPGGQSAGGGRQAEGEAQMTAPATGYSTLLTAGEVAKRLNVSSAWVRDHATRKQPRLPSVKLGKLLRFRAADVDGFVEQMTRRAW